VRQARLEQLSVPCRRRLHLRLAAALEALWGEDEAHAADIALHLYRAGDLADASTTVTFLQLAGRRALATAAGDEAEDAFSKALELEPDSHRRAELLRQRGLAWRAMGDWSKALPMFEQQGARDVAARLCWELSLLHSWDNDMSAGEAIAERGLAMVGEAPSVARCQLLAARGMNAGERNNYEVWADCLEQAIAMAEELGEERLLGADILQGKLYLGEHWLRGRLHAETADRAIEIVRRVGTPSELGAILGAAIIGYLGNNRFDDIEAIWNEALEITVKHGDFGNEMHARVMHGLVLCYRGRLEEGRALLSERADWCRRTGFAWSGIIIEMLGMAEFWRGDWDSARRIAEEINEAPIIGTMEGIEPAFRMLLLAYTGDAEAQVLMERLRPRLAVVGRKNQIGAWLVSICMLEAAAVLGQREACAELYPLAVQLDEDGTHIAWNKGLSERHAAVAAAAGGQWERAETHFAGAEAKAAAAGNRLEQAEILRWRAQMLLWRNAPNDIVQALEQLALAARAYCELGMQRHVGLAEQMTLQALGETAD
jgi:tetratricopeptide (TPR) repeat protein